MAHFAKIGLNGKVLTVNVVSNDDMKNADNVEDESVGQQFLERSIHWPAQLWIQTSYNTEKNQHLLGGTPFRGNFASVGYTWDEDNNVFWPPQPYASWTKDNSTASWKAPKDEPALTNDQKNHATKEYDYEWNESSKDWDLVEEDKITTNIETAKSEMGVD